MNRIFRQDGRALIVALDHGLLDGPCPGLENPVETITKIVAGGADAILTSYGIARRFAKELAPLGLILRGDGAATNLGKESDGPSSSLFFNVEEALRLGADALAVTALPGSAKEETTLENLAAMVGAAHRWGVPVLGEMVPGGFNSGAEFRTQENIAMSARIGVELGVDFIKTPYTPGFEAVTSTCFRPVVILGGAKRGSEREMLVDIKAAVSAGGAGVAIGRNIFQAEDPIAMTSAVAAILHQGASVDEAMIILKEGPSGNGPALL
jgi:class I fructose-bisphosphate aldolase/fructose-bisphosphate aldolase/2-amino-3,7-dideoxy-D-threo-hept-6-ulosonate synthase